MVTKKNYFKYWAKANRENEANTPNYHLLPYHCLDVAAVANIWWQKSNFLRLFFPWQSQLAEEDCRAWVLFFISLHDFGKADLRFQLKAPNATRHLQEDLVASFSPFLKPEINKYDHGSAGFSWFCAEAQNIGCNYISIDAAEDWMQPVAGHHGSLPAHSIANKPPLVDPQFIDRDKQARKELVTAMAVLFLYPRGLSLSEVPERVPEFLAGFCSICDWLGSNSDYFPMLANVKDLKEYYSSRLCMADKALEKSGMLSTLRSKGGMKSLFPEYLPRDVQTLVDDFTIGQGLTIIEAPTGSGKTEAALSYAVKLLDRGLADSLIFALPSQATANAMLHRLEKVADRIFSQGKNVILAHGKSRFNKDFLDLQRIAGLYSPQGKDEAQVQCGQWLACSRKRVFLGQVGVCTVDQVLLSVLPVRHQFVRSFGVRKSILIIDEVHAYDSYMYGLLQKVLQGQEQAGGSAILLSATLPVFQKEKLFQAWGILQVPQNETYPLVSQAIGENVVFHTLQSKDTIPPWQIDVALFPSPALSFNDTIIAEIIARAEAGAMVGVICNLVADAQHLAHDLAGKTKVKIDLFHSRFRFRDRMAREEEILKTYGKTGQRQGRILVATQVVEQSLDLDFDWLVSQLCPIDLLFQRLGRLHRLGNIRPACCEQKSCAIIVPADDPMDFGDSRWVYQNIRALRRTHLLLKKSSSLMFPRAYRKMIERVYQETAWSKEPEELAVLFAEYKQEQEGKHYAAIQLANANSVPLPDTDGFAATLTRDGELNISVIPVLIHDGKKTCLDGSPLDDLSEFDRLEAVNMETINVTQSWRKYLPEVDEDLICYLPMTKQNEDGFYDVEKHLRYTRSRGLEKIEEKE
jgi:CRISPR-associated endonuclease/helicase Cas3